MSMIEMFSNDLEREGKTTRKMLSIIPDDKFDWQPHSKSMTVQRLATHVAELPTWIPMTITGYSSNKVLKGLLINHWGMVRELQA